MSRIEQYQAVTRIGGTEFPSPTGNEFSEILYEGKLESVELLCPCGCGEVIYIPVNQQDGWACPSSGTIAPSVLMRGGCRSHFFIRNFKVEWA